MDAPGISAGNPKSILLVDHRDICKTAVGHLELQTVYAFLIQNYLGVCDRRAIVVGMNRCHLCIQCVINPLSMDFAQCVD